LFKQFEKIEKHFSPRDDTIIGGNAVVKLVKSWENFKYRKSSFKNHWKQRETA